MRGLCFALCSLVAAQTGFSGSYSSSSPQIYPNELNPNTGACFLSSTSHYYSVFNYTFSTAGVRTLLTYNVQFISTVTPGQNVDWTNLCNTSLPTIPVAKAGTSQTPGSSTTGAFGQYFNAATYTFIVMSDYAEDFVGQVFDGNYNGQTNVSSTSNRTWMPISGDSKTCSNSTSDTPSLYDTQVVSVNVSGYYDIFLTFARNTQLPPYYQLPQSAGFAILKGNNADLSSATCATVGSNLIFGTTDGFLNTQQYNVLLSANQNYTFVVQANEIDSEGLTYYGHYALSVTKARTYQMSNITHFTPPLYRQCDASSSCSADDSQKQAYAYATFTVAQNSVFYLFADEEPFVSQGASQSLEFYIYSEAQSFPLSACGGIFGIPSTTTCFDATYSLGSGKTYHSGSATEFTIVAVGYYQDYDGGYFSFFTLNGPAVNAVSAPASKAPTPPTSAATSGPTRPTTSGAPTSGTPSSSGTPTTSRTPSTAPSNSNSTQAPSGKTQIASGALLQPALAVFVAASLWA